ncbi:MAG: acetoacetate--CoA ligase [Actinomycetota bacterium]|nr:acetoacetate--CoA ligase [Actinomycetota bacterium]
MSEAGAGPRIAEGDLLAPVKAEVADSSVLTDFARWLEGVTGRSFPDYASLHRFSIEQLERFWALWWVYFDPDFATNPIGAAAMAGNDFDPTAVLSTRSMPGARWFEGVSLNYARYALGTQGAETAVVAVSETGREQLSRTELYHRVAAMAHFLRDAGVAKGDRVACYAPNGVMALVGFLATVSLGAIWSSCSPDFGASAVIDRFRQITPKVLLAVRSYDYNGRHFERAADLSEIVANLEGLGALVLEGPGEDPAPLPRGLSVADYGGIISAAAPDLPVPFVDVEFSHPLWILYSSGTTGLPKAIVQSQGGILLEHTRVLMLHSDIRPGDRFLWYTTTGWMMWNFLVSGLLAGSTLVLVDGAVGYPDLYRLYGIVADEQVTFFGTSAPFLNACEKAGIVPKDRFSFPRLRTIGSTGAPLSPEGFLWTFENVSSSIQLASASGGTDVCTAFLASSPWHDTRAGELACATLGVDATAFDEEGREIIDQVGELVIREPMPSMPVYFWNDPDGSKLREAYFSVYPGIWRHGDWIKMKPSGAAVIYGRSDSTLNRGGVRMGTSEFYVVVESFEEVADSMVVDTSHLGREGELVLLVVMAPGYELTGELKDRIGAAIRRRLSPRHVPDRILAVGEIPRTINGKKMEVPIRRVLLGEEPEKVMSKGSMANPTAVDEYRGLSERLASGKE